MEPAPPPAAMAAADRVLGGAGSSAPLEHVLGFLDAPCVALGTY